ncbi:MAG: hypothetical protein FWC72_05315 [Oscillospiraceae bacterium]|nr:hypothetical protein [Oscillospiraceae bacterium]
MAITINSLLGEILADPKGLAIFQELTPDLLHHPSLDVGKTMPFSQILPMLPQFGVPGDKIKEIQDRITALGE